jgi:two-component system chemotaxis response regulator CheB
MVKENLPLGIQALVVGASAGGVGALCLLLPALPRATPFPVLIVIHVQPDRPSLLVELFSAKCALPVREPLDKQPITPGIWFAPPNYHLLVEKDRSFSVSVDQPVNFSRPAIDVLFQSAAEVYGHDLAALVLTGASRDGADGARAVRDAGGFVMVQDPNTAEEPVMPRTALEQARPQLVAPLSELARALCRLAGET